MGTSTLSLLLALTAVYGVGLVGSVQLCCMAPQISGDAMTFGQKLYSLNADFEAMQAVEDWGGFNGLTYIWHNLATKTRYVRYADGTCRTYVRSYPKYIRCLPESARQEHVESESNQLCPYHIKMGALTHRIMVNREDCIPRRTVTSFGTGQTTEVDFVNLKTYTSDPDVFDKDLNDCVEAETEDPRIY